MSRTPARFTQADIARAVRAAKQAGAAAVELRPDGVIVIKLTDSAGGFVEPELEEELVF